MLNFQCPQDVFMAAAPLTISADRQLYVNFSAPFDLQPYTFMHARPKGSSKALLFVDPFTPLVRLSPISYCWALLILSPYRCGCASS